MSRPGPSSGSMRTGLARLLPRSVDLELLPAKEWCFFISASAACYYAFLPLIYAEVLGLSPSNIGVLCGLAPLVSALATPLWAAVADAGGCHRAVLLCTLAASAGLHCLLPLCPRTMACLVPLVLLSEAMAAPCVPLADAAIGLTLQRAHRPFSDYGKQRLWGAVSWGFIFSPSLGAVLAYAPRGVRAAAPYVGHVACSALSALAAARLAYPTAADAGSSAQQKQTSAQVLRAVLRVVRTTPGAPVRLLVFLLFGAVMGTMNGFLFLWLRVLGGNTLLDGLALAMTCVSETAIFWYAGRIQGRLGTRGCLQLVASCYLARLLLYAALPFLGGAWAVLPVQLLHGITFGLLWSVGNETMRALAPPGLESSLQSAFQGTVSLGACLGNVISGAVVQRHGFRPLFLGWAVLTAAAQALLTASESIAERAEKTAAAVTAASATSGALPGERCSAAEAPKALNGGYERVAEAEEAPAAASEGETLRLLDSDTEAGRSDTGAGEGIG